MTLSGAIQALTDRLAEEDVGKLCSTLLEDLRRDGSPVQFDTYFAANYGELSQLVAWSMKENFGSFFDGNPILSGLVSKGRAAMVKAATSTGQSGDP